MNRTKALAIAAAALFMIFGIVWLLSSGGDGRTVVETPKAVGFECTKCQYKFGVPTSERAIPPVKCPKCSGEAVQVVLMQPIGGGEPEIVMYKRYTRQQVEAMLSYEKNLLQQENGKERLLETPPDSWLASNEPEMGGMHTRYPNTRWFSESEAAALETSGNSPENDLYRKYKHIQKFPEDWPIEENVKNFYQ